MLQVGDPWQSPIWSQLGCHRLQGRDTGQISLGEAGRLYEGHSSVKSQGAIGIRRESNKRQFRAQEKGLECDITLRRSLGTGSGLESLVLNCVALAMEKLVNLSKPMATSHVFVHVAQEAVFNIPLSSLSASPLLSTELEYVQNVCACVCVCAQACLCTHACICVLVCRLHLQCRYLAIGVNSARLCPPMSGLLSSSVEQAGCE